MEKTRLSRGCSMRSERSLDTTVVRLSGELDLSCKDALWEGLGPMLDSEISSFILDLQDLKFIDSTGLGMLLSLNNLAESDGFDFTVLCGKGLVMRVLYETGLDRILPVVDPAGAVPATLRGGGQRLRSP